MRRGERRILPLFFFFLKDMLSLPPFLGVPLSGVLMLTLELLKLSDSVRSEVWGLRRDPGVVAGASSFSGELAVFSSFFFLGDFSENLDFFFSVVSPLTGAML